MSVHLMSNPKLIVVDLDDTLFDTAHRRYFFESSEIDWDGFFLASARDTIIPGMADIVNTWVMGGGKVAFISGRGMIAEEITIDAIISNTVVNQSMFHNGQVTLDLRPDGCFDSDSVLKLRVAEQRGITPENTSMVFEDRNSMVLAWRDAGFMVSQVKENDF